MAIESKAFEAGADERLGLGIEKQRGAADPSIGPAGAAPGRWADAGILLSVLLIALMSYIALRSTRQAEDDSDWVVHTQTVQKTLQSALGDAVDTVSGSRGFALTGQETFLDVEARAGRGLDRDLDGLRQLTVDNAGQQVRFGQLRAQVNAALDATIRIESARQRTGAAPPENELIESKRRMDAVKATLGQMQDEEARLLVLRQDKAHDARGWIRTVVSSSALVGMGLLTLCGLLLRRQINRGARMQAQFQRLNADLERRSADSRRAEAEAVLNELRLLTVAESSMDCLYLADAARDENGEIEDFVFTYLNGNAVRLVTYPREELIGGRMCELFPLYRKIHLFDSYKDVVLTGESFVGEFSIHEENIKAAWLRIQAAKLGDGVAITASDITGRKRQEEALRKSEALLERTARLTDTGGWEVDLATGQMSWSAELYRIHGVASDYRPTLEAGIEFYVAEDRPRVRAAIEAAMAGGDGWDMECTIARPDGSRVPLRVVGGAEFENGKPTRLTGASKDITQLVVERQALQKANERLLLATESGGVGIWEWDIGNDTVSWDPRMYRLYGLEPRDNPEPYELWRRHLHTDDRGPTERQLLDAVRGAGPYNVEFRIVWNDGSVHHIRGTGHVARDDAGRALRMVGTNWDVTAQKQGELELARLADFTQSIIASSPFATIVTDLHGVITAVNPAAERMLWYRREDLIHRETPLILLSPQQVANRAMALSEDLQSAVDPGIDTLTANPRRGKLEEAEWELIRRDGTRFDAQLTVSALTDAKSAIVGYVLIAYDITERKRAQDYISHLAHHDELTGLPTRTLFRDRLDAALSRATRYQRKVGLLMVDLDNFKKINDLMGHKVGDELLVVVAKRLLGSVRASDTVARMGGDEFTIILDELHSADDADLVAGKIVQAITMPVSIGSHVFSPTASIGISVYPDSGRTAESLFINADAAMYQTKAEGRNGRHTYSPELALAASRTRELEDGLGHALALKELELVYQPQICMKTGIVTGVEALLRWRSGKLGLVMPGDFISIAEENGMIVPIGEWVLRTACRQGRELQLAMGRPLTIGVNVSPRQFQQNDLPQMIAGILAESGLDPSSLELEITENILVGNLPRPKAHLEQIRSLGVHVAIDDFGTGFSSMSYILRFRVDRLKIDQSFIRGMAVDPDSCVVTNAVIALAKGLRIPVVAEGVETAAHRDLLLAEGCDEAQGYFYSKPLPMEGLRDAIHAIEQREAATALV